MWLVACFMLIGPLGSSAQSTAKTKGFTPPLWVKMMEDPNANYYQAIKEYENFWKGKEKPLDEEALMAKSLDQVKEHTKAPSKKEVKQERLMDYYRYQCKRFEHWEFVNKPYVQKDGHILTADERLKIWQQTQKDKQ